MPELTPIQQMALEIIRREFGNLGLDWEFATRVALGESSLGTNLVGDNGLSIGLFQLHEQGLQSAFREAGFTDLNDFAQQAQFTAQYVAQNGWQPWSAAQNLIASGVQPTDGSGDVNGDGFGNLEFIAPGVYWNPDTQEIVTLPDRLFGDGGGPSDIGPIRADLEQQRIDLDARISDMQNRIQDAHFERQDAIGAGNLDLAFQTERRVQQMEQERIELDRQRTLIDFQIQQQQLGLTGRGQDITQRGQDIAAQLDFLQLQFQDLDSQRRDAIARGDQELAAQIEERMRFIAESGNAIAQGSQNVDVAALDLQAQIAGNNQQIDLFTQEWQAARAIGDLQGQQDAELRLRAAQQQQAALQQQSLMLEAQGLGVQAQTSGGNILTQLANTEQQRLSELTELAANPRDFAQLQFALGGGQSFIQDLLNGIAPGGQSVFGVGDTPLLGAGFDQLIAQLGQRPAFEAALGVGQNLGDFQAPSTISMQDILGLGELPGLQQLPQFPNAPDLTAPQLPEIPQIQFPEMPPFDFTQPPPIPTPPGFTFTPPPQVEPAPMLPIPTQLPEVTSGPPLTPGSPQPLPVPALPPGLPAPQPVPSLPGATIVSTGSPVADQLLIDTATPGGDPTGSIDALMQLWREQGLIP